MFQTLSLSFQTAAEAVGKKVVRVRRAKRGAKSCILRLACMEVSFSSFP